MPFPLYFEEELSSPLDSAPLAEALGWRGAPPTFLAYMHVLVGASMLAASREPVQHIFTTSKGRVITCVDEVGWTNGGDLDCQT